MSEKQYTMLFVGRVQQIYAILYATSRVRNRQSDSVTRQAEDEADWDVGLRCANPTYDFLLGFE